jgi:hypothetical protein
MTRIFIFKLLCSTVFGQLLLLFPTTAATQQQSFPRDRHLKLWEDRNHHPAVASFAAGSVNPWEDLFASNPRFAIGVVDNSTASTKKFLRTASDSSLETQAATTGGPVSGAVLSQDMNFVLCID